GIAVAALARVPDLRQAIVAGEVIRWQVDARRVRVIAGTNRETLEGFRWQDLLPAQLGLCQGRRPVQQGMPEGIDGHLWSLYPDLYLPEPVAHPALQAVLQRKAVDEGTKPHPLDAAIEEEASRPHVDLRVHGVVPLPS